MDVNTPGQSEQRSYVKKKTKGKCAFRISQTPPIYVFHKFITKALIVKMSFFLPLYFHIPNPFQNPSQILAPL